MTSVQQSYEPPLPDAKGPQMQRTMTISGPIDPSSLYRLADHLTELSDNPGLDPKDLEVDLGGGVRVRPGYSRKHQAPMIEITIDF